MSVGIGPDIIEDGLVLCLDAADRNSYPGSGTTWYDLSGNGNNGTFGASTAAPTFSSANGGSIVFDGSNDYVSGNISSLSSPFTIECVGKFNNVTQTDYEYFVRLGDATTSNTMISISKIGNQYLTDPNYRGFLYFYTGTGGANRTDIDLRTTEWVHITLVTLAVSPYIKVYKNAIEGTVIDTLGSTITTNGGYRIGAWSTSWYLNGSIANTRIYNRELSANEVEQNYNATKGRFGL